MTKRKLALFGAAFAGAMLAASAGANDMNRGMHSGDRSAGMPSAANETTPAPTRSRAGEPVMPRDARPSSVNESNPSVMREHQSPISRSDNPNLPNPVTPSAANESAPQPQTKAQDPTNQPGIPPRAVGATR